MRLDLHFWKLDLTLLTKYCVDLGLVAEEKSLYSCVECLLDYALPKLTGNERSARLALRGAVPMDPFPSTVERGGHGGSG